MGSSERNTHAYLIDSNVWIGFYRSKDSLHEKAKTLFKHIQQTDSRIIISNLIIQEVFTVLSLLAKNNRSSFIFFEFVTHHERIFSIDIDTSWLDETTEFIRMHKLPSSLSLVDASNLVLCATFGLQLVTFDTQLMRIFKKLSL